MERITQVVLLVTLLIMFTSVVNQARAKSCVDNLGTCDNCEERCKAKHGLTSEYNCDSSLGHVCMCYYSASDCDHRRVNPHTT
ncbi:unnamed protein product [Eruca vesicaria subsp. sativa]|uniref:Defensin-like protein n=1 Tax=Eruca vesicaria subsp. sativa TaxID=29727 RepID=A0ABC8JF61_ERUVS|nr:unnamed protein product [Eruca vesicaria subsp. sativa]